MLPEKRLQSDSDVGASSTTFASGSDVGFSAGCEYFDFHRLLCRDSGVRIVPS